MIFIYLLLAYLSEYPILSRADILEESPLFLTPLLEKRDIAGARERALVKHDEMGNVESYSGYFTVNKRYNSNLFFWYFPSKSEPSTDPLLLWLQGGPGTTSLLGLFTGNGPFEVTKSNTLKLRNISWVNDHNVLYIDNPVGTGYSFTENEAGYATSFNDVAFNLYIALRQFFMMFPEMRENEFYATGESYAGKYVPALAYVIHRANKYDSTEKLKINLAGIAIGNGLSDPINQMEYSENLYELGLLDENGRDLFREYQSKTKDLIRQKKYIEAKNVFDVLIRGLVSGEPTIFKNLTGFTAPYNYLLTEDPESVSWYVKWVQQPSARKALHVGDRPFFFEGGEESQKVDQLLGGDFLRSVADVMEILLEHYRVLLYFGQLDLAVPLSISRGYLRNLNWSGAEEYKMASRNVWLVENELAGYTKCGGNLNEVLVRNAGHVVPTDQPLWASVMIKKFTRHESLC